MNSRAISLVLLALNLGLLGTIGYMAYLMKISPVPPHSDIRARVLTNTVTQIAVRKVYPTNFLASLGKLPISWAAIESTNYQDYIRNLHAIDCPEETIRDIILTDVAKLYAKRRATIRAQGQPYRFWQTGEAWENSATTNPATRRQLQELENEQRELIKQLLGVDLQTELAKYWNADDDQERMYGFLSQDKKEKVMELQAKYDAMEQEVYANSKGVMLDQDQEQLKKIQKQKEAELASVLSPEEMEEYDLRNSSTANTLRAQMSGFQPTEEEFRKIFRLQKVFDSEFNQAFDSTDENQADVKARAQQDAQNELNAEMKETLGEKRYNEWVRAQDTDYKALVQVAERFDLPKEAASRVYDMKQEAERQKQRLDANPNLSSEQRNNALAGIARETQRSIASTIGDKAFKAYQNTTGGQWIQNLGVSSAPAESAPQPQQPQATGPILLAPGVVLPPLPPGAVLPPFPKPQ